MQKQNRGFTLIEMVVAIAIIAAAFVGYYAALRTITLTRQTKNQDLAMRLATKKIEELKVTSFDLLPTSGAITDPLLQLLPQATSTVSVVNYGSDIIKQATVTIRWQEATGQKRVDLTTLLISTGGL